MNDCISRQAALNKINERQRKLIYCFGFENDMVKIMDIAKSIIIAIPSAQPEREKGEWIEALVAGMPAIHHEKCGAFVYAPNGKKGFNFCPNCGADMRGKKNE